MTSCVIIDASFAYRLLIFNADQAQLTQRMNEWKQAGLTLYAPILWLYEVTSTITKMMHFGQISAENGARLLNLAGRMNIEFIIPDDAQVTKAVEWTQKLKRASAYDSFYLAAAENLGCELWTMDKRLVNAANQNWVRYGGASEIQNPES
jgi:predicted nucleic acid-binding protein